MKTYAKSRINGQRVLVTSIDAFGGLLITYPDGSYLETEIRKLDRYYILEPNHLDNKKLSMPPYITVDAVELRPKVGQDWYDILRYLRDTAIAENCNVFIYENGITMCATPEKTYGELCIEWEKLAKTRA